MGDSSVPARRVVRFGVYEADLDAGELRRRGARVRLQRQPFLLLEALLERPGQVVTREELQKRLWPDDTFVDFEHGLNKAANKLREALNDPADNPRYVETLLKRGYRFIAPHERVDTPPGPEPESSEAGANAAVASTATPREASAPDEDTASLPYGRRHDDVAIGVPGQGARRASWWAIAAVSALVVVAGAWMATRATRAPAEAAPTRAMLVVLPFANLEGDASQDYFCDGITDELIVQISRLRPDRLGVIARTSAMQYRQTRKRVDQIAADLNVQYVLEGGVRRAGHRVRISATLVSARDQAPLWAETYERDVADVLALQADVARRIASSLALELLPAQQAALDRAPRPSSEAYDAYLRGRYHWNKRTPADLALAISLFESAIARDPSFGASYSGLADTLNVMPYYGLMRPRDAYPRSKDVATRALSFDSTAAAAHTALAYSYHYFDWNWPEAEAAYARAQALNPNYAQAHQWLAAHYIELGRVDDALREMERARQLDPLSLIINAAIGWINYHGRRYDQALAHLRATIELDGGFIPARLWIGQTYEAMGRPQEAVPHFQHVRSLAGTAPTGLSELAHAYAVVGRTDEARALLAQLLDVSKTRYIEADAVARVHVGLGEHDAALDWLERGFDERAVKMTLIGVDPVYDPVRASPRFEALLQRMHLR